MTYDELIAIMGTRRRMLTDREKRLWLWRDTNSEYVGLWDPQHNTMAMKRDREHVAIYSTDERYRESIQAILPWGYRIEWTTPAKLYIPQGGWLYLKLPCRFGVKGVFENANTPAT